MMLLYLFSPLEAAAARSQRALAAPTDIGRVVSGYGDMAPTPIPAIAGGGVLLQLPSHDDQADGHRLTGALDHHYPNYGSQHDGVFDNTGDDSENNDPFSYEGHSGTDWSMVDRPVYAAADGIVEEVAYSTSYGNLIVIRHYGAYRTLYAHLSAISVAVNQIVYAGDEMGTTGNTGIGQPYHLHFGVFINGPINGGSNNTYVTDPFGWRGPSADPLLTWQYGVHHTASCLWRSKAEDLVASCADFPLAEDSGATGGRMSQFSLATPIPYPGNEWALLLSPGGDPFGGGNGYHGYKRTTTQNIPDPLYHTWRDPQGAWAPSGIYELFVFLPKDYYPTYSDTHSARYEVFTNSGSVFVTVDQSQQNDRWISLGTFIMSQNQLKVKLTTNTDDSNTQINVDALKFRSYQDMVPGIHHNCP